MACYHRVELRALQELTFTHSYTQTHQWKTMPDSQVNWSQSCRNIHTQNSSQHLPNADTFVSAKVAEQRSNWFQTLSQILIKTSKRNTEPTVAAVAFKMHREKSQSVPQKIKIWKDITWSHCPESGLCSRKQPRDWQTWGACSRCTYWLLMLFPRWYSPQDTRLYNFTINCIGIQGS